MPVIGELLILLIQFYIYLIIFSVVVSWLIAFNVLSPSHSKVRGLLRFLARATDPVFMPVRRYVPSIGGIDISPIIILFALMFLQRMVASVFFGPSFH